MQGFFQAVRELSPDRRNIAAVVIEGEFFACRLLLSDGRIVWESSDSGQKENGEKAGYEDRQTRYGLFREEFAAQWEKLPGCGIYESGFGKIFCETPGREKKMAHGLMA